MKLHLLVAVAFLAACATAPQPSTAPAARPASFAKPSVMLRPIGAFACRPGGTAPLNLAVRISNHAAEAVMVRTIRLTTPVGQAVSFEPSHHAVNTFLEASQTDIIPVHITAAVGAEVKRPYRAAHIRAEIEFETGGARFWETFDLTDVQL
ncbi:MAG TPA: hypothetical protein VF057_06440 [Thermoanaerobaculia bacterium]